MKRFLTVNLEYDDPTLEKYQNIIELPENVSWDIWLHCDLCDQDILPEYMGNHPCLSKESDFT